MKSRILKLAVSAAFLTGASPAFADLIYVDGTKVTGTGLGAVQTIVSVQETGNGDNIESGCVAHAGGDPTPPAYNPSTACEFASMPGGDNIGGKAGNNTYLLSNIDQLSTAGELGLIVNVSEPGNDHEATLTDLYLALYALNGSLLGTFSFADGPMVLSETGGVGQSGDHIFVLDGIQAAAASLLCPDLSQCVVGAGVQFARNTAQGALDTVRVGAFESDEPGNPGEVPEPGSVALLGLGAMAMGAMRRRFAARK